MHHRQLVHLQVVAEAKPPAEVGDVPDRLESKLLLSERVALDFLILLKAINPDTNTFGKFVEKHYFEIDI